MDIVNGVNDVGFCHNGAMATLQQYQAWMRLALEEAAKAEAHGDIPVGAVVVYQGEVIARAHNRREVDNDPAGHAELLVIRSAAQQLQQWRLTDCTLVVTLEPCLMCASALVQSRVGTVVFGAPDSQQGGLGGQLDARTMTLGVAAEATVVISGVLDVECSQLLETFFLNRRS